MGDFNTALVTGAGSGIGRGMLQVYSPYTSNQPAVSEAANFGARGLGYYTVSMNGLPVAQERAKKQGAKWVSDTCSQEVGKDSFLLIGPDNFGWSMIDHVA